MTTLMKILSNPLDYFNKQKEICVVFYAQKKELSQKYKEAVAPLKKQRKAIFNEELTASIQADATLTIPREDFSLTTGLVSAFYEAARNTTERSVDIDKQLQEKVDGYTFAKKRLRVLTAKKSGLPGLAVDLLKGIHCFGHNLKLVA